MCVFVRHLVADAAAQPSDAAFLHVYVYMGTRASVKEQSTDGGAWVLMCCVFRVRKTVSMGWSRAILCGVEGE